MTTRTGPDLTTDDIRALLTELSDRLAARGQRAQLFVVGGAAMALAYDTTRTTRDLDAVFRPGSVVRETAEVIALAHGLQRDWLNDAAKGFMPGTDKSPRTVLRSESLLVQSPLTGVPAGHEDLLRTRPARHRRRRPPVRRRGVHLRRAGH